MAKLDYDIEGQGVVQLIDCLVGENKTPTKARQLGWDPDLKRPVYGDGAKTQVLATQGDASGSKFYRGDFSAKAGSLPTKDSGTKYVGEELTGYLKFFISEAGTIAGIKGDTDLKIGAFLHLVGDNPALATSWFGENTEENLTPYLMHGDTVKDTVPGDGTEVTIAPPAKIKTIVLYQFFQSNGLPYYPEVTGFTASGTGIGVKIKSKTAKSDITVKFVGYGA